MRSAPGGAVVAALGAACLLTVSPPAEAGVVALPSVGVLTVTVSPAATLSVTGSGATGSLGPTGVLDTRTGSTGYLVSVSTPGFDLVGPPVTASATTHIPSSAATVQVASTSGGSASSTSPVALPSLTPIFLLTYPSPVGLLPVSSGYTLSFSLAIPAAAGLGAYSGVVTQSVV